MPLPRLAHVLLCWVGLVGPALALRPAFNETGLVTVDEHTLLLNVAPISPMTTEFGDLGAYVYHSSMDEQVVPFPTVAMGKAGDALVDKI